MTMGEWDREEVERAMRSLNATLDDVIGKLAKLEHRIGHFYERFEGAVNDDDTRWQKLRDYLRRQFQLIKKKIGDYEDDSSTSGGAEEGVGEG